MENKDVRYYPVNAIRVCIDEHGGEIKGRIYSKMSEVPLLFKDCSEMLLRSDRLFDDCGYPQSYQEKREFRKSENTVRYSRPQTYLSDEDILSQEGKYRTIDILVKSRRRAGWQGAILGDNGEILEEFESELGLLRCLGIKGSRAD